MAEKEEARAVKDIQAAIRDAAERLEETGRGLGLQERLQELVAHHPENLEPMGSGDACPSVAWMAHGAVERAVETLTLALAALRQAASLTAESVRDDWRRRRVDSTQALLEHLLAADDSSGAESGGEDAQAPPREGPQERL